MMWSDGDVFVAQTKCKTWSCGVCRKNLLALIEMKIEYGCLTLEHSRFTTLTYVNTGTASLRDAASVRLDYELWSRRLKSRHPGLAWFKVPELTKKGMVHLHLVMGGMNQGKRKTQCETNPKNWYEWFERSCDCLAHELIREWNKITGAVVINVQDVYDPRGLGSYLSKYLTKAFVQREELAEIGFQRRYSCSRNWPRGANLQLRGTLEEVWDRVVRVPRNAGNWRYFEDRIEKQWAGGPMASVGDDYAHSLADRRALRSKRSKLRQLERMWNRKAVTLHNGSPVEQRKVGELTHST